MGGSCRSRKGAQLPLSLCSPYFSAAWAGCSKNPYCPWSRHHHDPAFKVSHKTVTPLNRFRDTKNGPPDSTLPSLQPLLFLSTVCARTLLRSLHSDVSPAQMALSLSSTRVGVRPCTTQRRSVRPLAPPRAGLDDALKSVADGFVKIFSKPEVGPFTQLAAL